MKLRAATAREMGRVLKAMRITLAPQGFVDTKTIAEQLGMSHSKTLRYLKRLRDNGDVECHRVRTMRPIKAGPFANGASCTRMVQSYFWHATRSNGSIDDLRERRERLANLLSTATDVALNAGIGDVIPRSLRELELVVEIERERRGDLE